MNLAQTYAQILELLNTVPATEKVIARMREKGHMSLLPQVVKILERNSSINNVVLTVAAPEDAKKYLSNITEVGGDSQLAKTVVDARVVGNYMVRNGQKFVDASYRRALVSLYQKTLKS